MLFPARKYVLSIILGSVLVGIAGQYLLWPVPYGGLLTFCCLDGFGIGALLAWVLVYRPPLLKKYYPLLSMLAIMACSIPVINIVTGSAIIIPPSRTVTSICTVWVIAGIILYGEKRSLVFNSFLNNRFLVFIGKISYGIYLYHNLIPHFSNRMLNHMNAFLPAVIYRHNFYLIHLENFCLLILISYASWKIIEQPILRLKKFFEYQKPSTGKHERRLPVDKNGVYRL
jgi:peptidoglycan/LPS O-acetylase OafA/YrhL